MGSVIWDDDALKEVVAKAARPAIEAKTGQITSAANAASAGFRTGYYHRDHKSPAVGGTQPRYTGDVEEHDGWPVGLVNTGNYAAMKDNHQNNTLLKARG